MIHIVLLGDSIFDNQRYTLGGPDVVSQVRELLPGDGQATLLAVDGATAYDIAAQIQRIPPEASHLVLSVGGNDALQSGILQAPVNSMPQALGTLADASKAFEQDYRAVIRECLKFRLPLAICTVYNGCMGDAELQRQVTIGLAVFNDVIVRVGAELGLTIIDLRAVCCSPADYANPIEPSSTGGAKIARAIVNATLSGNLSRPNSALITTQI